MPRWLTPRRHRGVEVLDDPAVPDAVRDASMRDLEKSNRLFGGTRAVRRAFAALVPSLPPALTLLDVGTGRADIPRAMRRFAARRGVTLTCVGVDVSHALLHSTRERLDAGVVADARRLPFADASVDVVVCSQLLHHFSESRAARLIRELDRVAARRVVISDLRRSWVAASGFWMASLALGFHPITRHDGTVSVLRGFTERELGDMVLTATGVQPMIRRRLGYRLTASWTPNTSAA